MEDLKNSLDPNEDIAAQLQMQISTIKSDLADITTQQEKNIKQIEENKNGLNTKMNKSGGTFTGIAQAYSNTSYTVKQVRNIILSPNPADASLMQNGDLWFQYKQ